MQQYKSLKGVFILFFSLLSFNCCFSQIDFSLGAGINDSNIRSDQSDLDYLHPTSSYIGHNFHLRMEYHLNQTTRFNFTPGLKVLKASSPLDGFTYKSTFIQFPLEVQMFYFKSFSFSTGINLNVLNKLEREINASPTGGGFWLPLPPSGFQNIDVFSRKALISSTFGLQYTIASMFEIGLKYDYQLQGFHKPSSRIDNEGNISPNNSSMKNSSISLSVFVLDVFN